LFGRAPKNFGKATQIESSAQREVLHWRAKATQIDCICSAAQRKISELGEQKQLKLTGFFGCAAKIFAIGEQKQRKSTVFEKIWNWRTKQLKLTGFVKDLGIGEQT
jgi:hypothetical protein